MITPTALVAVLEFLLPGYAWILTTGLHKQLSMLEQAVLSFVLSTCLASLLAAALTFLSPNYLPLSAIISLTAAAIVIMGHTIGRWRVVTVELPKFSLGTGSRALDLCIVAYAVLILGLFWSAPYYPTAQAPDVLTHANLTSAIVSGEGRNTLLETGYPIGLHFAAAVISGLASLVALQALRIIASAALFATVPLLFLSAREVLGNMKAAGVAVLVAAFAMPADALHLFRIGTFPNLMSDMIILTVVWLTFRYMKQPSRVLGLTLTFLGVGGLFMHSSFLILLAMLWVAVPFAYRFCSSKASMFAKAVGYSTIGLVMFGGLAFVIFHANLQRLAQAYIVVGGGQIFRIAFDEFAWSLLTFLGPVNVVALVCAGLFALKFRTSIGLVFGLLWLLLMVPGALVSGQAYRFVLFAMLPGSYLVGHMLVNARSMLGAAKNNLLRKLAKTAEVLILLLLIVSGVFPSIVAASFNPSARNQQSAVYDSMVWVQHNGCSNGVASVGLWPDYEYLPALTGIPYMGDFVRSPGYVLQKSQSLGFHCLVVARNNQYFQQYENDTAFHEKYRNELITVFEIA